MTYVKFEWDENKNKSNIKKHNVSFDEAKSVFSDDRARLITDPEHANLEDRFILLGMSSQIKILVVSHTYRENDEIIRIISARNATKNESKYYFERI